MNKQMNRRMNGRSEPPFDRNFETIIMLTILCVKFHNDPKSTSVKTTLTKNLNLNGWTNRQTNGQIEGHNLKSTPYFLNNDYVDSHLCEVSS